MVWSLAARQSSRRRRRRTRTLNKRFNLRFPGNLMANWYWIYIGRNRQVHAPLLPRRPGWGPPGGQEEEDGGHREAAGAGESQVARKFGSLADGGRANRCACGGSIVHVIHYLRRCIAATAISAL
jgi:hypothetical protein